MKLICRAHGPGNHPPIMTTVMEGLEHFNVEHSLKIMVAEDITIAELRRLVNLEYGLNVITYELNEEVPHDPDCGCPAHDPSNEEGA